ncbi:MAG: DUF3224 domain-containing protein [Sphingosinicella sp.]|nr:DUF3224 domain-containing protein [Sphingosinicella sp.]
MTETAANGTFDVKLTPMGAAAAPVGALAIAKTFQGDLEGTSVGQMLAIGTAVEGSAGYVAMERVTATLSGREGSFALQHSGSMDRGTPSLLVSVVPDSGTGHLTGLKGEMDIEIEGGKHFYTFRYSLSYRHCQGSD